MPSGVSANGLLLERHGDVAWIVFNRPQAGNAMDAGMMSALPAVWRDLDADPDVRCIVVTGQGKAFQTGLDVAALAKNPQSLRESSRRTRNADIQLTGWHLGIGTPIVTAVNGVCAGGGIHFVIDSDIVIASERAYFVDPHVSVGQVSSWEAIGLMRRISGSVAARLALVGVHERLETSRALQIGLVSEVVAAEDLRRRAQELAEIVAANDPETIRTVKSAIWAATELGFTPGNRWASTHPHLLEPERH